MGRMKGKVSTLVGVILVLLALGGVGWAYGRFHQLKRGLVSLRGHMEAIQGMANPKTGDLDLEVAETPEATPARTARMVIQSASTLR